MLHSSCGVCVGQRACMGRGHYDGANIGIVAAVGGAGREGVRPHLFIREPVRTHDGGSGKFAVELLDVFNAGKFQVHNGHIGTVARDGLS